MLRGDRDIRLRTPPSPPRPKDLRTLPDYGDVTRDVSRRNFRVVVTDGPHCPRPRNPWPPSPPVYVHGTSTTENLPTPPPLGRLGPRGCEVSVQKTELYLC